MSNPNWNEAGRVWEEDYTWLDDDQRAECSRADRRKQAGLVKRLQRFQRGKSR